MKMKRQTEVTKILKEANRTYTVEGVSKMSDSAYDILYAELQELEKETGIILEGSPTQIVGGGVEDKGEVAHETPALSLSKVKDLELFANKFPDEETVVSWKEDGLTLIVQYSGGVLKRATTRGDGNTGADVTENARRIKGIPVEITEKGAVEVRGEVVMSYSDYLAENTRRKEKGEKELKHVRNAAVGTIKSLDPEVVTQRGLNFVLFDVGESTWERLGLQTYSESLAYFKAQNFEVVEHKICKTAKEVKDAVSYFTEKQAAYKYAVDGLVKKINNLAKGKALGVTNKYPLSAIAYKWEDQVKTTKLKKVFWSVGRTGRITPVAVFDELELESTLVTRATLSNLRVLQKLQLGVGDEIGVYKANKIIPTVACNNTRSGSVEIPRVCPKCGEKVKRLETKTSEFLLCENTECQGRHLSSLAHYNGKKCADVDGVGVETLKTLVAHGFVTDAVSLYSLQEHTGDLLELPKWGRQKVRNLLESVERARTQTLGRFIRSLAIDEVGTDMSKVIALHFGSLEAVMGASEEALLQIDKVGAKTALSIIKYFQKNTEYVLRLASVVNVIPEKRLQVKEHELSGKVFCITGALARVSRKEMEKLIEEVGGKVTKGVTGKTDYLITNDPTSGSSKNKKARELGKEILTEDQALKKLQ